MTRIRVPVILAGGSGARLWPWSRDSLPKQFLSLMGDDCLLAATLKRVSALPDVAEVLVVLGDAHRHLAQRVIDGLDIDPPARILVEPAARNTAPAIALATNDIAARHGEKAAVAVFPADHMITDQARFQSDCAHALESAAAGQIATIGITPSHPETGYGYIQHGELSGGVAPITGFTEKPNPAQAQSFLDQGSYLWNAGMFFFTAATGRAAFQRHCPAVQTAATSALDGDPRGYIALTASPFDRSVMEHTDQGCVVPAHFGWSDLGSWPSVHQLAPRDGAGNAIRGDVWAEDCRECLVFARDRLVVAMGLRDLTVVETEDAVLIASNAQTQPLRQVVKRLKTQHRPEADQHPTDHRPWGSFTVLEEGPGFKVKRLDLLPQRRLSLQRHAQRTEDWVVVGGTARVTLNDQIMELAPGQTAHIPKGCMHRIENPGSDPLCLIEVQTGAYLGEDDIERFEDDFGRVTP